MTFAGGWSGVTSLRGVSPWLVATMVYSLASRLAYVVGVGAMLRRQDRDGDLVRRYGVEEGFHHFRRRAALLINNDALAFVLLCLVSWETGLHLSPLPRFAGGVLLVGVGLGIKWWAVATLPPGSYYWRNFFVPAGPDVPGLSGPYRYLRDPMYTVGYLHSYGAALLALSAPAMVAALFAHVAILLFNRIIERPHYQRLR